MALANASFKIDITEKGSGPLVLASHPPASAQSGKIESHRDSYRQRLFQQPARSNQSVDTFIDKYIDGESSMQVAKWGNSLAVRLPAAVVEALGLREGDEIEIRVANSNQFGI